MTDRRILVGDATAVSLPPLEEMKVTGLGASVKRSVNDLYVVPLGDAVGRTLNGRSTAALYVDESIPFRALVEVLFTLSQAGVNRFVLATAGGGPPTAGLVRGWLTTTPGQSENGRFVVVLVNFGFAIKVLGHNVAPGCVGTAPGVAVPKLNGTYDYAALSSCIASLRSLASETETSDSRLAYLAPNPGLSYGEIISAVEAVERGGIEAFQFKLPR